ncbi:MAG: hypothetical protein ACPGNV_08875 [Mangrovicoccus sp.]
MPLDKFVLLLVVVLVAAGVTVAGAVFIAAAFQVPLVGLAALVPVLLLAYIALRVISDRLRNREDDHYDRVEK